MVLFLQHPLIPQSATLHCLHYSLVSQFFLLDFWSAKTLISEIYCGRLALSTHCVDAECATDGSLMVRCPSLSCPLVLSLCPSLVPTVFYGIHSAVLNSNRGLLSHAKHPIGGVIYGYYRNKLSWRDNQDEGLSIHCLGKL